MQLLAAERCFRQEQIVVVDEEVQLMNRHHALPMDWVMDPYFQYEVQLCSLHNRKYFFTERTIDFIPPCPPNNCAKGLLPNCSCAAVYIGSCTS